MDLFPLLFNYLSEKNNLNIRLRRRCDDRLFGHLTDYFFMYTAAMMPIIWAVMLQVVASTATSIFTYKLAQLYFMGIS